MAARRVSVIGFARNTPGHGLSAVHYYRVFLPLKMMQIHGKAGWDVDVITQDQLESRWRELGSDLTGETLKGRDIMVISRLYKREGLPEFIEEVHKDGTLIVFDTDDDLTCDYRELGRGDDFKFSLRKMDAVTVSTPFLGERMADYVSTKPLILPNHVDFDWFSQMSLGTNKATDELTIGLVGTASHHDDWIYPVKAFKRIAEKYPKVKIVVAGFFPEYLEDIKNILKIDPVPYPRYPGVVRQFDIVCCSLDPKDVFNQSKSAIKALESMAAVRPLSNGKLGGAVPVCTDMAVYRRVVNHGHNGFLVPNDGWYEMLEELIKNERLRNNVAVTGTKWVRKHRDMKNGWVLWARAYKSL